MAYGAMERAEKKERASDECGSQLYQPNALRLGH